MRKSVHLVGYSHVYVGGGCMDLHRSLSPSKYLGVSLLEFSSSHGGIMICNG
jgi:hypothetical protein